MHREKTKVLHIIKSLGRGGAETLLPETLRLHNKDLFEFHYLYFLPWKDQMVQNIQQHGGKVTCFQAKNNIALFFRTSDVVRYIKENNIKLIHAHLPWAGIVARLAGIICKIPVIYTEHNKQERYHNATRFLNLLTLNLSSKVIAVSEDVAQSITKNKVSLNVPVITIRNGVNIDHFMRQHFNGSDIRNRFNIPPDSPIIGTVAVFRFQKRLDLWMEIASRILHRFEDAHFIMVGDGPLKQQLIEKRDRLGLTQRMHMPGLETEVRPFLAAFDLYMMSSVFEGLPIALLEAMSMQCPIVATTAGGIAEVVRHGIDGYLCPVDQSEKLVDYACSLLQDNAMRSDYGLHARQRVSEGFSLNRMVHEIEDLYNITFEGS